MTDLTVHAPSAQPASKPAIEPPLWLLAELTYRCPLHCVFCYNPVNYTDHSRELTTAQWLDVLREARALGAAQLGFSGGEPLLRDDLEVLVGEARQLGFYTNLITSGIGLTDARLDALKEAGLDHIQLSFQDSTQQLNDFLSSTRTFDLKKRVAASIKAHGFPMVLNCVLHRFNLPHVGRIIEMALDMGAEYLELANTQYYGWAHANRVQLMPTADQLCEAEAIVERYRQEIGGRCTIYFVVPDYFETRPKRCMNGWGAVFLDIAPDGAALPCHTARSLPGFEFPNVTESALREIWYESDAFNRFRGFDWMKEPCRSCEERDRDLGGCRCQAFLLTGDPAGTAPVCDKSQEHGRVIQVVRAAEARAANTDPDEHPVLFRNDSNSRKIAREQARERAVDSDLSISYAGPASAGACT
jgi:pyrroloquinoline quinone biosynthesis protein E